MSYQWNVLLPMAFRLVVPPLTSGLLNIFKNSAVCLAAWRTDSGEPA